MATNGIGTVSGHIDHRRGIMKRILAVIMSAALAISLLAGCGGSSDAKNADAGQQNSAKTESSSASGGKSESTESKKEEGCDKIEVGNIASDGYELNVAEGTFEKGAKVTVETVSDAELSKYQDSTKFNIIGKPVKVSSDSYNGGLFGTDVMLTLPIPGDDLENYVVLYWDESTGDVRYFEPSSFDTKAGTMTVCLPHFSLFGSGELSDQEKIDRFLDQYAAKEAIARSDDKKAASDLEPYIKAKLQALNLTEDAARELSLSLINQMGSGFGEDAGTYTDIVTTAIKSIDKGDPADFESKMEELISNKLYDMLNYNLATGKADSPFKDVGKAATILGAIAGGDTKAALTEIGDVIGSVVPAAGITTKAVAYVGAKVDQCFTNWKSNQIEELYQAYKNGAKDFWGNEVIAGDEESLKNYIYYSHGFTMAKGVYRFYNMDKVAETCEKYGWGRKEYDELDEKYRAEFDRRAEEGLMNYFRTRLSQEKVAEQIKADERACIEQMMDSTLGCLTSGNFSKFFGEASKDDYNITNRLERLVNVKRFISQYVDEDKLKESSKLGNDGYNYGNLLNQWVLLASENKKSEAVDQFIVFLKDADLLNPAYANSISMNELAGTYSGISFKALRVSQSAFELYAKQYGSDTIQSRAQCDEALAEQLADEDTSGLIENSFTLEANKNDPAAGTLKILIHGDEEDVTSEAKIKLDGEKLIVTNGEGTTSLAVAKGKNGKYTLKGDPVTFDLVESDEGIEFLFFIDTVIDAKQK